MGKSYVQAVAVTPAHAVYRLSNKGPQRIKTSNQEAQLRKFDRNEIARASGAGCDRSSPGAKKLFKALHIALADR